MLEGMKVLLLDVLLEDKAKKSLLYWPLAIWVTLAALASAYDLSRGTQVRAWILSILVPVAEIAPFMVRVGEVFALFFFVWFLGHLLAIRRCRWSHLISDFSKAAHLRALLAEFICMITSLGLAAAFLVPYRPDMPGCYLNVTCDDFVGEGSLLFLGGSWYLLVAISMLIIPRLQALKPAAPSRTIRSSEH
jgi:hypothetical protein